MIKKAQEEMFGFALIVVLVMVVGLVFLSIGLRNTKSEVKAVQDIKVDNFLDALLQYTTNYTLDSLPEDVKSLIQDCEIGKSLDGGISSCDALNRTVNSIVVGSWCGENECPDKGYHFEVTDSSGGSMQVLDIGNQTKSYRFADRIVPPSIDVRITVYN